MNNWHNSWDAPKIEYKDYAIGGKMITVSITVPENVMLSQFSDDKARESIRRNLCDHLASAILKQKLVEINSMKNPLDYTTTIVARAYIAPDQTVKLLRTIA